MTPKTELVWSNVYMGILDKQVTSEDIEELKEKCAEFMGLYEKHIKKIMAAIPKYSGFGWEEYGNEYIPIYIVPKVKYSFSCPLTIAYKEDQNFMFVLLLHELMHNNMDIMFPTHEIQEGAMDLCADYVLRDVCPELGSYLEYERSYKDMLALGWDLDKHTIKGYLVAKQQKYEQEQRK